MSRYNRDETKRDLIMAMEIALMARQNESETFVRYGDLINQRRRVRAYRQNRPRTTGRIVVSIINQDTLKQKTSNRKFDLTSLYGQ